MNSLPLPTLEHVAGERADAAAVQLGADLTQALLAPQASITSKTRAIETFSPLFRGSAANLQPNLFGEPPEPAPIAGVLIRHFALCNGETVQLGDFGICPNCATRHKTLRRIRYSTQASRHTCDARCMAATGPNCECSCGGKNHGAWNDSAPAETETDLFE